MFKQLLNPPNWFTSASLCCSVIAIALVISADEFTAQLFRKVSVLIIIGGICDMLDGRVARMLKRQSEFGVQLDTIADTVGFGVAPAMIAWSWKLHTLGRLGLVFSVIYVLSAAFRLARFNVDTCEHRWRLSGHTQGLTTTMAGGSLVSFIWLSNGYLAEYLAGVDPLVVGIMVLVLGLLMISSIPFRNFKNLRKDRIAWWLFVICVTIMAGSAIVFHHSLWWGMGALLYIGVGTIDGLIVAIRERRLTKALMMEDLEDAIVEALGEDE